VPCGIKHKAVSFNIWAILLNVMSHALIQAKSADTVKSTVCRGNKLKITNTQGAKKIPNEITEQVGSSWYGSDAYSGGACSNLDHDSPS
jgi:hypothetical protein